MNALLSFLKSLPLLFITLPLAAQTMDHGSMTSAAVAPADERLGTVSFPVSCAAASQVPFNRGVALLHDFWYDEAQPHFTRLVKADPACAMAHWGVAMSVFHQIWDRPSPETMKLGWTEMQAALALPSGSAREQAYIAALAEFYRPGAAEYPARIAAYSAAMGRVYAQFPDVDSGAFYALSLLAAKQPDDTSFAPEQSAMAVLTPLFARYPDNPGVVHYIIHACDNPAMAAQGLAAADHYGEIAPSGPHAYHMPGHIYARLGLWQKDIASQMGSIAGSEAAEAHGEMGMGDEPHSYDFLIYAYLQSADDARARAALDHAGTALTTISAMPNMSAHGMGSMVPYYRDELPAIYALEIRDWKTAAEQRPVAGATPETATVVFWARAIAHGRLHEAGPAHADLARYDDLLAEIRKGKHAYRAEGIGPKIERNEMLAWVAFADGKEVESLNRMREAADLQDKVGQGEVDIPAREMLADLQLEYNHPQLALAEYEAALKLSPNRLNGLYNAGRAAEASGQVQKAAAFYASLLKSTNDGANSSRPELAHARSFVASTQVAAK